MRRRLLTTALRALLLAGAGAGAAGCGRDRSTGSEAVADPDSTRFGDDRAHQGGLARTSPDVALLERLVDEYERLDVVMDGLSGPSSGSPVKGRAWSIDRHEDTAKGRLLALLQDEFGERYHARTPAGAVKTTDSIGALSREDARRAFDGLVLAQHQRVARLIAEGLPAIRSATVRDTLAKLYESVVREIRSLSALP